LPHLLKVGDVLTLLLASTRIVTTGATSLNFSHLCPTSSDES
jgi:hypothetical protein